MKTSTIPLLALVLATPLVFADQAMEKSPQAEKDAVFIQADANADGSVSVQEAGQAGISYEEFTGHDGNQDNALDEQEFAALIDEREAGSQSSIR